jgi:hypothetical protein
MRALNVATAAVFAAALAGCSTVSSRIKKHQAAFDASSPEVQQKIRDRQVDVGFTQEQVAMALGRPDRTYTRKTSSSTQEVWAYGSGGGSSVGFGFGMASGWSPMYSGGVGINSSDGGYYEDRIRVVFENGVVASVENRK